MSRQRDKGTKFETACAEWLRARLGDPRIERRAPHGSHDLGDLYGIWAHGLHGIAECKDHAEWGDADAARWQAETLRERGNADAGFALLVVHRKGCGAARFGLNWCAVTLADLLRMDGRADLAEAYALDLRDDLWVWMHLEEACRCIEGRA